MKAVAYSSKVCEKQPLIKANNKKHEITLISNRLTLDTISYAKGKDAVLAFASDDLSAPILQKLKEMGVKYISTRCTDTDNIDIEEAGRLGIKVANVPAFYQESIAEHALTLILALLRNIIPAYTQTQNNDFSLSNLLGGSLKDKTVGIIGFGKTGKAMARILQGFGCTILVHDAQDVSEYCLSYGTRQVSLDVLLKESDIITLHVPLTSSTKHMINARTISKMKDGVMLVNVSRGAVFHTKEVLEALQREKISKVGMDVYEFENNVFFFNHSKKPVNDPLLKALLQNQRVLLTPHQAFLTEEALQIIAQKTIENLDLWDADKCVGEACCCDRECIDAPKALSA